MRNTDFPGGGWGPGPGRRGPEGGGGGRGRRRDYEDEEPGGQRHRHHGGHPFFEGGGPEALREFLSDPANVPWGRGGRRRGPRGFGRPGGWQNSDLPPADDAKDWFT